MAHLTSLMQLDIDSGSRGSIQINHLPDTCGSCGKPTNPVKIYAQNLGDQWDYGEFVEVVFQCSRNDCKRYFIAAYKKVDRSGDYFTLSGIGAPTYFEPLEVPDLVKSISPNFERIYNQAYFAEQYGLEQICGSGYRKALEFLIKEYLVHKNPTEKDSILKTSSLGSLFTRIKDPNIKSCVERATWLGNDEVHYLRLWQDKDIKNMKELLELSIYWVKAEMLTEKYNIEMDPKNKSLKK